MLQIIPFIYHDEDDLSSNTYLLIDSDKNALIIDPSSTKDGVVNYLKREEIDLKGILLTHGHIDHFRGVKNLVNNFHCPVFISFLDSDYLKNPTYNCSLFLGKEEIYEGEVQTLIDKEKITLLNEEITVITTPYHTEGSVCYYNKLNNILFSGDSLFKSTIGRSDLPGSNPKMINSSLNKLFMLPENTKVYPGHGGFTTIKDELRINALNK
jgi:glyoxylase-like metal-dependent hydrolase (beta-lactamase superfamily II)